MSVTGDKIQPGPEVINSSLFIYKTDSLNHFVSTWNCLGDQVRQFRIFTNTRSRDWGICLIQATNKGEKIQPGPKVTKLFSCITQLSTKFILLINVKMPTIVGILTFISRIKTTLSRS